MNVNPDVYPITAQFQNYTRYIGEKVPSLKKLYETMVDVIGEYEHGTVDADTVFNSPDLTIYYTDPEKIPMSKPFLIDGVEYDPEPLPDKAYVQAYADVCADLLLTMYEGAQTNL